MELNSVFLSSFMLNTFDKKCSRFRALAVRAYERGEVASMRALAFRIERGRMV